MNWYIILFIILFIILGLISILNYIKAFKNEKNISIDINKYRIIDKRYYKMQLIVGGINFINIIIWSIIDIWVNNIGVYSSLVVIGYLLINQLLKILAIKRNYICNIFLK